MHSDLLVNKMDPHREGWKLGIACAWLTNELLSAIGLTTISKCHHKKYSL